MSGCEHITDEGLVHLSSMPLETLSVCYCKQVTDAGLAHLSSTAARFLGLFFIIFTDFALKNTLKLKLNQFCFYRLKIHHITGPLAYQTSTSFTVIVFFRIFAFGHLELFSFCSKYTPFLPILLPKTP